MSNLRVVCTNKPRRMAVAAYTGSKRRRVYGVIVRAARV